MLHSQLSIIFVLATGAIVPVIGLPVPSGKGPAGGSGSGTVNPLHLDLRNANMHPNQNPGSSNTHHGQSTQHPNPNPQNVLNPPGQSTPTILNPHGPSIPNPNILQNYPNPPNIHPSYGQSTPMQSSSQHPGLPANFQFQFHSPPSPPGLNPSQFANAHSHGTPYDYQFHWPSSPPGLNPSHPASAHHDSTPHAPQHLDANIHLDRGQPAHISTPQAPQHAIFHHPSQPASRGHEAGPSTEELTPHSLHSSQYSEVKFMPGFVGDTSHSPQPMGSDGDGPSEPARKKRKYGEGQYPCLFPDCQDQISRRKGTPFYLSRPKTFQEKGKLRRHLEAHDASFRSRPEFFPQWAATFENANEAEKAWERRVKKHGPDYIPRPNVNLPDTSIPSSPPGSPPGLPPGSPPPGSPPGSPPNAKKRRKNRDAYFADKLGPEIRKFGF